MTEMTQPLRLTDNGYIALPHCSKLRYCKSNKYESWHKVYSTAMELEEATRLERSTICGEDLFSISAMADSEAGTVK